MIGDDGGKDGVDVNDDNGGDDGDGNTTTTVKCTHKRVVSQRQVVL